VRQVWVSYFLTDGESQSWLVGGGIGMAYYYITSVQHLGWDWDGILYVGEKVLSFTVIRMLVVRRRESVIRIVTIVQCTVVSTVLLGE
jgi:hypothetical protein